MKLICLALLALSLSLLGGCHVNDHSTPAEMAVENDITIARTYGMNVKLWGPQPNLRAELERRKTFSPEEWSDIDGNFIRVGMREIVLYASWGIPDDQSTLVSAYGRRSTLWYGTSYTRRCVSIHNGTVESWTQ